MQASYKLLTFSWEDLKLKNTGKGENLFFDIKGTSFYQILLHRLLYSKSYQSKFSKNLTNCLA